jgi:HAE1 family hydrophobic/amphiphilic exporter-1
MAPVMSKVSPNDLPIMSISATSNLPATEFAQKMKDDYLPQLQQLRGVAEITLLGSEEREVQVKVDREKLKLYKIPLSQVVDAINRAGIEVPAGKIQTNVENNSVRLTGKISSLENIKNIQVAMPLPNSPVYVKDLASVVDGIKELASISRYNGKNCIGLMLKKGKCMEVSP